MLAINQDIEAVVEGIQRMCSSRGAICVSNNKVSYLIKYKNNILVLTEGRGV